MKNIYILLTQSRTSISRGIHLVTGDAYTHASIAYDADLKSLCSFARKYIRLPLPAGLVKENLYKGYYSQHHYIPCMLLKLTVDDEAHQKIKDEINKMLADKDRYKYNVTGLFFCYFGKESRKDDHYFCSQFVAELLENTCSLMLPKKPSLMRPQDFTTIPELECIYIGKLSGLMKGALIDDKKSRKTPAIANEHIYLRRLQWFSSKMFKSMAFAYLSLVGMLGKQAERVTRNKQFRK